MTAHVTAASPIVRKGLAGLLLAATLGCAMAQTEDPVPIDHGKAAAPQQQRRAALRAALKAQRDAQPPKSERALRQLTPVERAKLREQLRQQRRAEPVRVVPADRNTQPP